VGNSVDSRAAQVIRAADEPGALEAPAAYLQALVDRDPALLATVLAPAARMRALIPPGLREASGADQVASLVVSWFADADAVELRESDAAVIGLRGRLRYRLRITEGAQVYDAEQVAYFTLTGNQITACDLICSGFHPMAAARADAG
jgi:hypothetical protein